VGLVKALPFRMHLALDWVMGPFMALSPFLFGWRRGRKAAAWLTPLIGGLWVLGATAMTRPTEAAGWDEAEYDDDALEFEADETPYGTVEPVEWQPAEGGRMPAGNG
jgi:hypothetical protein